MTDGVSNQSDAVPTALASQMEAVMQLARTWQEGQGRRLLEQQRTIALSLNRLSERWNAQMTRLTRILQETSARIQDAWQAGVPMNWVGLAFQDIDAVLDLMEDQGWALIWTPSAPVIQRLLTAEPSHREGLLLSLETRILDDLEVTTQEIRRPELTDLLAGHQEALASFRDGRLLAAQALSTAVFTTLFHRYVARDFGPARRALEALDPRDTALAQFRLACVLRVVGIAIATYYGQDGEPQPTRFNRHASAHGISRTQCTRTNAVTALMLSTSLLREIEDRGELLPGVGG